MPRRTRRWCGGTEFIPAHAAFGYLARRYGLRVIAVSGLTPEAEPSASRVKEVVRQARRGGLRVVFLKALGGRRAGGEEAAGGWGKRRGAETIAREGGGTAAMLEPLESLTVEAQRAGKNYFTVMHENLDQLAQGLDCRWDAGRRTGARLLQPRRGA